MNDEKKTLRQLGPGPDLTPIVGRRRIAVGPLALKRAHLEATEYKLDGVQDVKAREVLARYFQKVTKMVDGGIGLIITGGLGVGKSTAASIIGCETLCWGYSVLKMTLSALADAQTSFIPDADGLTTKDRMAIVDMLILDGLNEDFIADRKFGPLQAEHLIARRNEQKKVTIVTTRLFSDGQTNKDTESLFSTMRGSMVGLRIQGLDLRLKKSADLKRSLMED